LCAWLFVFVGCWLLVDFLVLRFIVVVVAL